ncbi:uncharacterized protein LOC120629348 [Pararge aegeria]|uniref:Jg19174 protein n=4 Tax=Pararge aegeria TaxID=116150 RepID=A0A8S4SDJ4_9NEOP|nr:uncharacterized protein LOC120629348 [Pararge aegeria]CAH2264777.1 jg19174 [Pararge aegeria aegeria]
MENTLIQNKVKLLFEKISDPKYVMNNYYADHFFTKIRCADPEVSYLRSWPLLPDLIIEALNHSGHYHNTVKVFLIRILGVVAQGEVNFAKIFPKKGDEIAKAFSEINSHNMDSSLRVAYLEVALALVNHNSGVFWLLESGAWREILRLCNEKRTVFVVRQTYKFASSFIWKLNDIGDEANVKLVLLYVISPMTEIDLIRIDSMTSEEEDSHCKTFEPMLQILLAVVSNEQQIKTSNIVIEFMLKDAKVLTYFYIMLDRLRREDVSLLITKCLFWMSIGKIFLSKPVVATVKYDRDDFIELAVTYFNTVHHFIKRRCATTIFDYCNACNLIWALVWKSNKPVIWERDGRKVELHKQLLVICLVPSLVYITLGQNTSVTSPDRVNDYIFKVMNTTCEHTARTAYALRDLMLQLDTQSVTLQSVKRLTCLKNHLNDDQANLVFQALFYVLKEYDPLDENGDMKAEPSYDDDQEKVLVMTYVLDTLLSLVKNYNINWQESLEVICLHTVVYNILKRTNLSCKFVVTALNVISITVKKFLPPNLSLLMESKPGSTMHELGKLIYIKMHDLNWEVRDSALELLYVVTDISFIKFPPFQKQILSNKLINMATTMALNDHEFYVRASALRCIGAASKMSPLWEQLKIDYPNIQELLLTILANNPEGIVRKEACNVLCDVYQNVKMTPNFRAIIYDHMVCAALSDFHWEVQITALKFWKIVIQSFLNDQGMLDGTFPPVTFSRETRKIVTLNDKEIQRRLSRILDELSSIGCLTVLVKLLHEDTEVDIMDAALSLSMELLDTLDKYKVPENLKPNENDPKSVDELLKQIKLDNYVPSNGDIDEAENLAKSDNVIEGILKADDINLLASIYERHMSLDTDETETKNKIKLLKFVTPYLFVTFLKTNDLKQIIEQKKNWKDGIKSLSSLLDDVLGIYEVNDEVNDLDCY